MWISLIYPMNSLLIIFAFNIIICCTWNIIPRAVDKHTPRREKTCLLGFWQQRVSNQSLRLNRLIENWIFLHEAILGMILLKKQTTKLLMRLRGCAGWSGPLLLYITGQVFSVAVLLLYVSFNHDTYKKMIIVKYDNSDRIVICAVSSKHFQWIYRHTKSYPAGDRFLYHIRK